MADKKLPPGLDSRLANQIKAQDLLNQKSTDMSSARANRINSLHRSVEELTQEQNRKRMQVSNEVSALTRQQQKMMAQLELERSNITSESAQAYSNVIHGLGRTINHLATGVKNITVDTGKATSDAINQYGKAISEDISLNKTNTVAMALSTATPLFGYFAGKFMETDVFQSAVGGIKDKVKNAMTEGVSKASGAISNIFRKGKQAEGDVPHLQDGGYVRRGGLVEVHAAEVVTPIDTLMNQFSEERYVAQRNIAETFVQEFMNAKNKKEEKWQNRLVKSIEELKVGMIGVTSRFRIALQSTLLQHPTFKNLLTFADLMKTTMISPLQFLFGARGGYGGDVRSAMSTNNVFQKSANLLSLIFTTLMPKIDNLLVYTKAQAEAIVGGPISPAKQYTYTMFDKIREFMTSRAISTTSQGMFEKIAGKLGLDKKAMEYAGINSFSDLLSPGKIAGNMGITGSNILGKATGKESVSEIFTSMKDSLFNLVKMKRAQEKREGPHSPSMAENIATTAKLSEKMSGVSEDHLKETKAVRKGLRGWVDKIWDFILLGFGLIKNMIGSIFGRAKGILGFGGKTAASTAGGAAAGGLGAKLLAGGKFAGKMAGRMAGFAAGGLIGSGMGLWDMFQAIRSGDGVGFVGNWMVKGIAGFLGGTESGLSGAKRGAMKGAALGAAAGSVIPGLGTLLGGAVGAAAGGVLGFFGGAKISQAMSTVLKGIKNLAKGVWNIAIFPFKAFKEGLKSAWVVVKWGIKNTLGRALDAFKEWWKTPSFLTGMIGSMKGWGGGIFDTIKKFISGILGKIKDTINNFAKNIHFPIVTIAKVFQRVRKLLDESIEKIPVIGAIYKAVKKTVKDIHSGSLADNLEAALNAESAAIRINSPTNYENTSRSNYGRAVRGSRGGAVNEAKTKGMSREEIIAAQTEAFLVQKEIEENKKNMQQLENELNKNIKSTSKQTQAAIIQNTNVVSQTNSSLANITGGGTGGGRNGRNFSSGYNFASQVVGNNLN